MVAMTCTDFSTSPMASCQRCEKRENRLCAAIRLREKSVLPLVPEKESVLPETGEIDVTPRRGRFGMLHSGLLLRCGGDAGGMELILPSEPLVEAFRANRDLRITAVVPSQICWFDIHDIEASALRDMRLSCALLDASTSYSAARQTFARLRTVGSVAERLAKLLVTLAGCIAERDAMGRLRMKLACQCADVAVLLGTTVTALGSARTDLEGQGLIALHEDGAIEIRDRAGLEVLADMRIALDEPMPPARRMPRMARCG